MRRPPIVCRRAVQSLHPPALQHAWVPDHVLSLALARFFPISCPHQKRNGSSVPGPLEAKRRAAKRRMTLSAHLSPHDSFSPPLSLASLFGFRSSPQPAWRYEPPSLPHNAEPLDWPSDPPWPPSALNQPHLPQASSTTHRPSQSVTPPSPPPDMTQNAVSEQNAALASTAQPQTESIQLAPPAVDASPSLAANLTNDEDKIACMVAHAIQAQHSLVNTSKKKLRARVPAITAALGGEKAPGHQFFTNTHALSMDAWLRLLHRFDSKPGSNLPGLSLMDTALVPLTRLTFTKKIQPDALIKAMLMTLAHKGALQGVSVDKIFDLVAACVPLSKKAKASSPIDQLLQNVVLQMHVESLPYHGLLELALPLIARYARMDSILKLLNKMEHHNLPLHDRAFIDKLVEEKISLAQSPNTNLTEKRRQQNIYNLRICNFIQILMTRMHTSVPEKEEKLKQIEAHRQFQHILNRAKEKRALPLVYQNLSADMSPEQRTELVHQLARHYSLDKSHSYLAAWRTMYFLYRYLLLFSLPIGPLFAQAVVQASLVRPLAEKRFVSARRLIWVCQLVAKVEGDDAAREVEKRFWLSRGQVINYAKHAYVSAGGRRQDKAHIGTMKKLGLV